MTNDKFHLWRLGLSIIHLDGRVDPEEVAWFQEKIGYLKRNKILGFSAEQINELESVFTNPVENFYEEFENIKKPADASFLLHLIRTVGHIDGNYDETEENAYWKLESLIQAGIDKSSIMSEMNHRMRTERVLNEERKSNRGILDNVIDYLLDG